MGLDTTHDCFHGSYGGFMRWRRDVALYAGLPPLDYMEGFWREDISRLDFTDLCQPRMKYFPIRWECLKPTPLTTLLHHSDCDGEIEWEDCESIADELQKTLESDEAQRDRHYVETTERFIAGLRLAFSKKENVGFH